MNKLYRYFLIAVIYFISIQLIDMLVLYSVDRNLAIGLGIIVLVISVDMVASIGSSCESYHDFQSESRGIEKAEHENITTQPLGMNDPDLIQTPPMKEISSSNIPAPAPSIEVRPTDTGLEPSCRRCKSSASKLGLVFDNVVDIKKC